MYPANPRRHGSSRRRSPFAPVALAVLCFCAAAALVAGCGRQEITDDPPNYVGSGEDSTVSQVGQGGTARVALPASMEPECLNPYLASCAGAKTLNGVVFEGLLTSGPSSKYRAALARNIPSYEDGTLSLEPMSVEVRLREKAAFSNGDPVEAKDVKWTYEQAASLARSGGIAPSYSGFSHLEGVEVEGPRTVRLGFDAPYPGWQSLLAAPILPSGVYGGDDLSDLSLMEDPVGSGPFLFTGAEGGELGFTASPRYWLEELEYPRLDGLEVEYEGPSVARESLASSRADAGFFTPARTLPDSGGLLRGDADRTRAEVLLLNSGTLNEGARRAVLGALDRGKVASEIGMRPARAAFVGGSLGSDPPTWEESGGNPGGKTSSYTGTLRLVYPAGGPLRDQEVEEISSELEDSGASVEASRVSRGDFYGSTLPSGDFDLALLDLDSLDEYGALESALPPDSAAALQKSLTASDDQGQSLIQTQKTLSGEAALAPMFVWPDSYAWSSTLSGPQKEVPLGAMFWNVREWGFYK